MLDRRSAAIVIALAFAAPLAAQAAAPAPFSQGAFDEAVKAGKPVLVHIATGWCPICKAQKPVLEKKLAAVMKRNKKFVNALGKA